MIWHEDVGNYIFSLQQDETSIKELEQRLEIIVSKLNEMIKAWEIIENDDDSDNINPSTWAPDLSIVDPYIPDWGE